MSFADLKRTSSNSFDKLTKELNKLAAPNNDRSEDDRYWKPTVDKAGNGYAVIRFLPPSDNEDLPFVRIYDHGFQGPGGWYIEKSLTTLNQPDPLNELNGRLWNSGLDSDKEVARKQKRRLGYHSNIYVVKDPANPENEGKVFLYKYGKKIFDKLNDLMNPQFEDEKPVNPFDLWTGANFKLKIRQVEGYRNYDKSEFDSSAPLSSDDDELEAIWKRQYSLQELLDPKHFKTYDELKARLDRALGNATGAQSQAARRVVEDEDEKLPWAEPAAPKQAAARPAPAVADDDDDDSLDFFKKLAEDDED